MLCIQSIPKSIFFFFVDLSPTVEKLTKLDFSQAQDVRLRTRWDQVESLAEQNDIALPRATAKAFY
jgi:hypothetical protein